MNIVEVKTFSASTARQRNRIGDEVNEYLDGLDFRELEVKDKDVRQSSDREFHCISIVLFVGPKACE